MRRFLQKLHAVFIQIPFYGLLLEFSSYIRDVERSGHVAETELGIRGAEAPDRTSNRQIGVWEIFSVDPYALEIGAEDDGFVFPDVAGRLNDIGDIVCAGKEYGAAMDRKGLAVVSRDFYFCDCAACNGDCGGV